MSLAFESCRNGESKNGLADDFTDILVGELNSGDVIMKFDPR